MDELSNQQVNEFLRKQTLVKGITDAELSYLVDMTEQMVFGPSELIFPEGENSNDLYFIYEGEVSINKLDPTQGKEYTLGVLKSGDSFGDLAFLDDEPRSSAVKTNTETRLLKLSKESSYAQSAEMVNIYNKIMKNIAKVNMARLRETNQSYINKVGAEVSRLQKLLDSGKVLLIAFLLDWVMQILTINIANPFMQDVFRLSVVSGVLIFVIQRYFGPLSHYGLKTKDWNIRPGITISLGLITIVASLYIIGILLQPIYPHLRWINFVPLKWNFPLLIYPLFVFLNEFIFRGVIQTSLKDFLQINRGQRHILYTSILISLLSFPYGISWVVTAFIINYLLGYFYDRYPNLLSVALVHATIGIIFVLMNFVPQSWMLRI